MSSVAAVGRTGGGQKKRWLYCLNVFSCTKTKSLGLATISVWLISVYNVCTRAGVRVNYVYVQ